ncbi:MAG: TonB-dependent receptor plug domain-containing protein [Segetibacter sp.]
MIAQERGSLVKGLVQNNNNEPVYGASIIIRNTKNNFTSGASTDSSGIFTFSRIPSGGPYNFTFSAIGYESQTLSGYTIKDNITLSLVVKLKDIAATMNDVVVIGYGAQRKKDITGAVASLSTERFKDQPVSNVEQALKGQVAGVQVSQNSGSPSAGVNIKIRGTSSITAGNEPLFVIDGFPISAGDRGKGAIENGNPLNTINPNDIESIDILKDASATAIYGSRGSNGVVIITTKSGKAGKPKFLLMPLPVFKILQKK